MKYWHTKISKDGNLTTAFETPNWTILIRLAWGQGWYILYEGVYKYYLKKTKDKALTRKLTANFIKTLQEWVKIMKKEWKSIFKISFINNKKQWQNTQSTES